MNKHITSWSMWAGAFALIAVSQATLAAPPVDAGKAPGRLIVRAMDANEDGVISRDEFKPLKRGSRLDLFVDADVNEDGQLSKEELDAHISERQAYRREQALADFEANDLDGDGTVTRQELDDIRFAELDQDQDGQLSATELGPERQERRQARMQPRRQNKAEP